MCMTAKTRCSALGRAGGRTQIVQFGMPSGDRLGNQVAEHKAGRRASIRPGLLRRQRSLRPGFPRQDSDRVLDVYAVHRVPGTLSPA
jgi:hypothetical protein